MILVLLSPVHVILAQDGGDEPDAETARLIADIQSRDFHTMEKAGIVAVYDGRIGALSAMLDSLAGDPMG